MFVLFKIAYFFQFRPILLAERTGFSMKLWCKALVCGLGFCLLLSLCGFQGECDRVRGSVLRLHVLANSDSAADQALKLQVRDAVVEAAGEAFGTAASAAEAESVAAARLDELTAVAQRVVDEAGYDYRVTARITDEWFDTRTYGDVTLPAGTYRAVEFLIGEGAGRNWWCVLFPPMCVSAATDATAIEDVLDDTGEAIVSGGGYAVRFKIVEWIETLADWLKIA